MSIETTVHEAEREITVHPHLGTLSERSRRVQAHQRMERDLSPKEADDRKGVWRCQGESWIAIYKVKRSQEESASGADDVCVA